MQCELTTSATTAPSSDFLTFSAFLGYRSLKEPWRCHHEHSATAAPLLQELQASQEPFPFAFGFPGNKPLPPLIVFIKPSIDIHKTLITPPIALRKPRSQIRPGGGGEGMEVLFKTSIAHLKSHLLSHTLHFVSILNKPQLIPGTNFSFSFCYFKKKKNKKNVSRERGRKKKYLEGGLIVLPLMGRDWNNGPEPTRLGTENKRGWEGWCNPPKQVETPGPSAVCSAALRRRAPRAGAPCRLRAAPAGLRAAARPPVLQTPLGPENRAPLAARLL